MADEVQRGVTQPDDAGAGSAPALDRAGGDPRAGQFWIGVFGGFSLVAGLTWILLNAQGPRPAADIAVDVVVGAVLAAGGLVLMMPHRVRLPTRPAWLVAGAAAVLGSTAGLVVSSTSLAGIYAYVENRGFPFGWLTRGGIADDPATARQLASMDAWDVNVLPLIGGALVWAYAGILIFVLVRRLRAGR
jgi:hypothetical protein